MHHRPQSCHSHLPLCPASEVHAKQLPTGHQLCCICRGNRDIKLENVLLDAGEPPNPKLSDFGLGALPDSQRDDGLLRTSCGTPNYVAPEVLSRRGYDGFVADLWSLGAPAARLCSCRGLLGTRSHVKHAQSVRGGFPDAIMHVMLGLCMLSCE